MNLPISADPAKAGCGEGLLWDEHRGLVWWVDIAKEALHSYDPATQHAKRVAMPYLISALALDQNGDLLIATKYGLGRVDPENGTIVLLHDPEPDAAGNRLNDMLAGPDGALWIGTMSEGAKGPTGALYRYADGQPKTMMTGCTISNGLASSPDGTRLYFVDSVPGILHVYEDDIWQVLRRFDTSTGKPDGLTVDADGTLWIAICDRGQVIGMTPEGEITTRIDLPCEIVTNCTFGGADLKTLFVTTGTFSMTDQEKAANPAAGGLFTIEMGVAGLPPHRANWPEA
ncbi:SMP-30/gluconolactonase/LRE family protein [Epibacterium ulvae]|uniref:SMP-30/gluconolactonase/LRE family protein n=1 Tax=Epibacterium ulvae TaxID=1156985 RepID=UPI001BFC9316|nr:SMP-30/gluconolactonase/LRE family protein [Epibacterium ulvae]MBT8152353.1 SMP-30/gluconolactonase/LRE family protein [Epibacterium ulvae]